MAEQARRVSSSHLQPPSVPSCLHSRLSSSTSKMRVALGGMTPGWPVAPYATSGVQVSFALCPKLIWAAPSSKPLMTSCLPILNLKGLFLSLDESNFLPF